MEAKPERFSIAMTGGTMSNALSLLKGIPLIENPAFGQLIDSLGFDPETKRVAVDLHTKGYALIEFPEQRFDELAERIRGALLPRFNLERWAREGRGKEDLRIQDAWRFVPEVRRLAANHGILTLLERLYGRRPFPFQTLNFPVGSQQHFHTDAVHFNSVPERFMCGVWVALEDISDDAGPLVYYPGSHRLPILVNEHLNVSALASSDPYDNYATYEAVWTSLVQALDIKPERFCPSRGHALIWSANLLHGGDHHRNRLLTRWSQVTHYFFEDCAYYTPLLSDPVCGSMCLRTDLMNVATERTVSNRYAGSEIPLDVVRQLTGRRRPRQQQLPAGFDSALYLAANPDVKAAGMDAKTHYIKYGAKERRRLRP